ncbi:MAG: histidine phosphatase family protein [Betaproteobacteria bacterium]
MRIFLLALLLCLPASAAWSQPVVASGSQPVRVMAAAHLLAELRNGGYVLYFRHFATDFSQNDEKMRDFDDCANQRLLTDRGRSDARRVGATMRELKIPVGRVLASPYCRTVETAQLLFGRAEKMNEVRGGPAASGDPERYAGLRTLMSTRPEANLVISSHGNPFQAVAGPPYLAEGEMAVIKPLGDRFEITARVRIDDWNGLAAAGKRWASGTYLSSLPR